MTSTNLGPEAGEVRVRDFGEQALLQRLQRFCPPQIVGDDAAVLSVPSGRSLVATTDVLVDGVHFSLGLASPDVRTTSPADAGWRAAAANLSDLAAMGADSLGITVGLALPGETPIAWVEGLYEGLKACLDRYGGALLGGDVCRSPVLTVSITALGSAIEGRILRRSAAQPGDVLVATGWHGASRAGLELLLHPERSREVAGPDRDRWIQAHQRPQPRLDVLPILAEICAEISSQRAIAGMDSSDGLADAVLQICRASGVGAHLERDRLPIPPGLVEWVGLDQARQWTLYGGEDFELVLALPKAIGDRLVQRLGSPACVVGTITAEPQVQLIEAHHHPLETLSLDQGFQHF
ncbi:thiamine-phosphate kinase [Geitlerinema sp. PCC 7407]|uniref:thiamine-phosphate kinase n=1 Tax=Geitlerinema sp. PCC 7407 TaxID=1173025 RepID=UPI00029FF01B|nr:thiamine-phosphate kinase [Geitlerinema sp. PCC 7407]AFY67124.1 thiamine-phosphate kinase [Geitlerinema sp. PCC 7407]